MDPQALERDERLGEAIESYLSLAESGDAPDPEEFASHYPDLSGELLEALEGLAMVQGLVGSGQGAGGLILEAGRRIAGYRVVRELGRGGMGVVYEAVHVDLDRPVALKVLGPHHAPDSHGRRRFLNEAKTAAGLHHTHIVPVFDVGQVGGLCYYAMQRIEGSGLDRVIKSLRRSRSSAPGSRSGPATVASGLTRAELTGLARPGNPSEPAEGCVSGPALTSALRHPDVAMFVPPRGSSYFQWVTQVGRQSAEALEYAHGRGVVHRDIKPSNLLVDTRGTVWVADFGLARRETDPGLTQSGPPVGTPRYMSPEQASGGEVDARTDIYSLGATLYELLTLRPPFDGNSPAELSRQITQKEPIPPRKIDPRIARDLETIVLKAMAKRPSDRYARAQDLADDLERYQTLQPVKARRISVVGRFLRFAQRHPYSSAISAAAATIVLAVATWAHLSVVKDRNEALVAKANTQYALLRTQEAIRQSESARAQQYWREASLIRLSSMPDRRREGLNRLGQAAALGHDEALRVRLREEAVEFLGLRDIEARAPVETGRNWGMAFTSDGRTLAALSDDAAELVLQNQVDGTQRRIQMTYDLVSVPRPEPLRTRRDWGNQRVSAGIAACGPWLAIARRGGHGVTLVRPEDGTRYATIELPDRVVDGLVATPDGRRLITLERSGVIQSRMGLPPGVRAVLWDTAHPDRPIATLAEPETTEPSTERMRPMFRMPLVAVSPDSRTVAVTWLQLGGSGTATPIVLFDATNGSERGRIDDVPGPATALAFGPEGLVAAAVADGSVWMWLGLGRTPLPGFYHNLNFVSAMRFSPDGRLLAVAGYGTGIELWDPATNTLVATVRSSERVRDLAFSPTGETLAALGNESISLWAIVEPIGRSRISGFASRPTALAFDESGTRLAISTWMSGPRVWRVDHPGCTAAEISGLNAVNVMFSSAGDLLLANPESLDVLNVENHEHVNHFPLPPPADAPQGDLRRGGGGVRGSVPVAAAIGVATQGLWAVQDVFRREAPTRGFAPWLPLARSGDGTFFALARGDEILLWRAGSANRPKRVDLGGFSGRGDRMRPPRAPQSPWMALALSTNAERLYALNWEGRLRAWELRETKEGWEAVPLEWTGPSTGLVLAVLSPNDNMLAVADNSGKVLLMDAISGQPLQEVRVTDAERRDRASALAISPNGTMLAAGSQEGVIGLWAIDEWGRKAPQALVNLPGHRGGVTTLTFDPTGTKLASGGDDKSVQVWRLDEVARELAALNLGW